MKCEYFKLVKPGDKPGELGDLLVLVKNKVVHQAVIDEDGRYIPGRGMVVMSADYACCSERMKELIARGKVAIIDFDVASFECAKTSSEPVKASKAKKKIANEIVEAKSEETPVEEEAEKLVVEETIIKEELVVEQIKEVAPKIPTDWVQSNETDGETSSENKN